MSNDTITFEQFKRIHLKVGEIVEVTDHPDADRLYVLKVDIGEDEPRTIVAGIKQFYPDKNILLGKQVIIVTNLEPKELRGVKSEGMLLAGCSGNNLSLVSVDRKLPPGTVIS
ncbi:MAG: methionine--tRNA ligase subunit beta [Planctomycetota bacterium]